MYTHAVLPMFVSKIVHNKVVLLFGLFGGVASCF